MKDLLVLIGYESDNDFANGFADIINKLKNIKTMVSIKNKCYEQRFSSAGLLYVYINGYKENEMIYSQQTNSYQCIRRSFILRKTAKNFFWISGWICKKSRIYLV
jgi:hypothetical protein